MAIDRLVFLASPYSHHDQLVREERYVAALEFCAEAAKRRVPIFSPVVHWHLAARTFRLSTDANFWWELNRPILDHSDILYVLKLDGWERSIGVGLEIKRAKELGKPIDYVVSL